MDIVYAKNVYDRTETKYKKFVYECTFNQINYLFTEFTRKIFTKSQRINFRIKW